MRRLCVLGFFAALACSGQGDGQVDEAGVCTVPADPTFAPRAVTLEEVPVGIPDGQYGDAVFVPGDSEALLMVADVFGSGRPELAYVRIDGSELGCLTCGLELNGHRPWRPIPHPDGHHVLFHVPSENALDLGMRTLALECIDGFRDCAAPRLLPLRGMESTGTLMDRWHILSPDGKRVVWLKVRADGLFLLAGDFTIGQDEAQITDVRIISPNRVLDETSSLSWRAIFPMYEPKDFYPDGTGITFSGTLDAGKNLEEYALDLRDGSVRRLTNHPDWDEDSHWSPDGRYFTTGSARKQHTLDALGLVPIPPYFDNLYLLMSMNYFFGEGHSPNREAWLFSAEGDFVGGQRLAPEHAEDGWFVSNGPRWSSDGTRILMNEFLGVLRAGMGGTDATRIVIATFDGAAPVEPMTPESPSLGWASMLEDLPIRDLNGVHTLAGQVSGQVTLEIAGSLAGGQFAAIYENYSDDGIVTIDGTQTLDALGGNGELKEEFVISGCNVGSVSATVVVDAKEVTGTYRSKLGERELTMNFD